MDLNELDQSFALPPEIVTSEIEKIDEIQVQLESLDALYQQISDVGGVSMEMAQQMVNDHALELSHRTPINSFSKDPSTTNLKASMEAIDVGKTVLLAALIGAAAIIIVKLTQWLIEYFRSNRRREAQTQVLASNVVELAKAREQLRDIMEPEMFQAITDALSRNEKFTGQLTELHEDLLSGGLANQLALTCWEHLVEWDARLTEKMRRIKALSGQQIRPGARRDSEGFIQMMDDNAEPIEMFNFARDLLAHTPVHESPNSKILPYAQALTEVYYQKNQTSLPKGETLDSVVARTINAPFLLMNYYGSIDKAQRGAVKLDNEAKGLKKLDQTRSDNPGVAEAYKRSINNITEETRALTLMWNIVETCAAARRKLMVITAQALFAQIRELTQEARKITDKAKADRVNAVANELRRRLKSFV